MRTASFVRKVRSVSGTVVVTVPVDVVRYLELHDGQYIKLEVSVDDKN